MSLDFHVSASGGLYKVPHAINSDGPNRTVSPTLLPPGPVYKRCHPKTPPHYLLFSKRFSDLVKTAFRYPLIGDMTVKKAVIVAAAAEVPDLPLHKRGLAKVFFWNDVGGDSTTETESGSSSSTEEVDSPKSTPRWRPTRPRKKAANVHSQVLRVREEDAHVGEDITAVGSGNAFGVSPVLPCSRLSHLAATVNTASVS